MLAHKYRGHAFIDNYSNAILFIYKTNKYEVMTTEELFEKFASNSFTEEELSSLREKCKNINNRVQKRRQQLEWLKEYKKSLIFDYVTGKKRVEK